MKRRISSRRMAPLRLELPSEQSGLKLTLIAYGNLCSIDNKPHIWCLFCDEKKQLHESQQPLSKLTYFTLGSLFNNAVLVNQTNAPTLYDLHIKPGKTKVDTLPHKLLEANLSGFQGQYYQQLCIKVRNKQLLLTDIALRALFPDPGFTEFIFDPLSQSMIMSHIRPDGDHLYVVLDNIYSFRVTTAAARQFAWMAVSPEYRSWQRAVGLHASEALSSSDGLRWDYPPPNFELKVTYSSLVSPGRALVYRATKVRPALSHPFKAVTIYFKEKSETFWL